MAGRLNMPTAGHSCIDRGSALPMTNRTMFVKSLPFSSTGNIEKFCVYFAGAAASRKCKLKVFRQNGTSIDFVAESAEQDVSQAIRYTFDISALSVQSGDCIGLWSSLAIEATYGTAPTGEGIFYKDSDETGNSLESSWTYSSTLYEPSVKAFGVYYVKTTGNDSNDGSTWANAFATVNKGMTTVDSENTLHVGFGTYSSEPANNTLSPDADDVTVIYETATTGGGTGTATVEVN